MFVKEMAIAGMTEVELGKLATERAQSAGVKEFGQMMVKDQTQAGAEPARAAAQLNVPMPKQLDQKHCDLVDRLSKLTSAAFDREYMNAMVPGHEEVAAKLRAKTEAKRRQTAGARGLPERAVRRATSSHSGRASPCQPCSTISGERRNFNRKLDQGLRGDEKRQTFQLGSPLRLVVGAHSRTPAD
jgi:predicted outer membrane protein